MRVYRLAGLLALTLLAGCGSAERGGGGTFSLALTDAPVYDASRVVITFDRVQLVGAADQPPLTVWEGLETVDLLDFSNCRRLDLVPPTSVPAGVYEQIRLRIVRNDDPRFQPTLDLPRPNFIELPEGIVELEVPSGPQTGEKLEGRFEIAPGGHLDVVVDFDVRRSVVRAGASGLFLLKPVLRAVDAAAAATISGRISKVDGSAFGASERPVVYAWQGPEPLIDPGTRVVDLDKVRAAAIPRLAPPDAGAFCLGPLAPGTYSVTAVAGVTIEDDPHRETWDGRYQPVTRGPFTLAAGEALAPELDLVLGSP